ncbi:MAG: ammonia-forming cytochrome c nitrite reductase subunit c552 [Planctomycetes bacterium]|nr:ammonia-forming cytochrome c nitrite reductase subunit c552 [Planctomycetota bacterium]
MKLLENIHERKIESRETVVRLANITETTVDPAVWGQNFPRQYDTYKRTVDISRTKYGGSEAIQKLDAEPNLRTMFNGYAFAIDFREERGHAYMLSDQRETERVTQVKQPGSCLQCHAANTVAYRKVGLESGAPGTLEDELLSSSGMNQLFTGFEKVCSMPYDEATKLVSHAISCLECHDPKTMALRVTRPGFITGIAALARSDDPVPHMPSINRWREGPRTKDYDPNAAASRQEMRSFVCGQCHVEYYFAGKNKLVTYPWSKGITMDAAEEYYDEIGWKDWTHKDSGAPVLKAQHPEFEMWSQGIHARSGVSCADCHMPYVREGAVKVSDHQVRSPLLNVSRSCEVCHRYPEAEILARVDVIQTRTRKLLDRAEDATVALIRAIAAKKGEGASDEALAPARALHRKAQWRADYCAAENSMGFHAPGEYARILAEAIDYARQGEIEILKVK